MKWFILANAKPNTASARRPQRGPRRLGIERCEDRRLMAVVASPALLPPDPAAAVQIAATSALAVQASTQAAKSIDFDVTVKSGGVVPTQARDLNLLHVFGGEKLTVPTVVKNYGPAAASGSVTVAVYLSPTRELSSASVMLGQKTVNVNLPKNATQVVALDTTVPTNLTPGAKYWIVAKLSTPLAQSTINDVRPSDRQFEFVGTPSQTAPFRPNANGEILYFKFIRDTLNADLVIQQRDPAVRFNDPRLFIAHWEGNKLYPYLENNVPKIGIDVNLNSLSPTAARILATAVRSYYRDVYGQTLSSADADVITMLKNQARSGSSRQALTARDSEILFNQDYKDRQQVAVAALGQTAFSKIDPTARIAVMDMVYSTGSVPANMVAPLKAGDYVRAGFELVNSARTTQNSTLTARTEADFQNLLFPKRTLLGGRI